MKFNLQIMKKMRFFSIYYIVFQFSEVYFTVLRVEEKPPV